MFDFCFGFIYASLLALGGIIGWATKGSMASLTAGLTSAGIISLCSYASLTHYHAGRTCKPATAISLLVAGALTWVMWQRWSSSGKVMPAGMVCVLSAAMSAFYAWSLVLGPVPVAPKQS